MSAEAMKKKVLNALQEAVNCGAIKTFTERHVGEVTVHCFNSNKNGIVVIMLLRNSDDTAILYAGGYELIVDDLFITCADGLDPMLTFERRGIRVATFGGKL
jgi:hypothetical protein|nr:MAG TPA: hypothetical protein [Caudoviricetes sp.]